MGLRDTEIVYLCCAVVGEDRGGFTYGSGKIGKSGLFFIPDLLTPAAFQGDLSEPAISLVLDDVLGGSLFPLFPSSYYYGRCIRDNSDIPADRPWDLLRQHRDS